MVEEEIWFIAGKGTGILRTRDFRVVRQRAPHLVHGKCETHANGAAAACESAQNGAGALKHRVAS